jgi:hypothetical protein
MGCSTIALAETVADRSDLMVVEDVAQMGPMLVLAGLAVGWLCEAIRRAGGYGFLVDLSIAIGGSVILGGIVLNGFSSSLGMVTMFGIGCVGAVLALMAQRTVWPSRRSGT